MLNIKAIEVAANFSTEYNRCTISEIDLTALVTPSGRWVRILREGDEPFDHEAKYLTVPIRGERLNVATAAKLLVECGWTPPALDESPFAGENFLES